ncbi:MAG TPA: nucleoside diphosphate kinase regulator [Cellvibrionaceae bacterium]
MDTQPEIIVSARDYKHLGALIDKLPGSDITDRLLDELERATLVEPAEIPPDVVTMRSRVTFTILSTQKVCSYTLVYPADLDGSEGQLSVFTPVGSALLGLSVGQEIEWPLATGKTTRVRIDSVDYQPERAGEFNL